MRFFLWQIRCLKTTKRQREISNNSNSKIVESYQFRCKDVIRSSFVKMSYFEVNKVILGHLRVKKRDLVVFGSEHVISGQFFSKKVHFEHFCSHFWPFHEIFAKPSCNSEIINALIKIKFKSSISNNSHFKITNQYRVHFQILPNLINFFKISLYCRFFFINYFKISSL